MCLFLSDSFKVFVEKSCRPGRDGGLGPPFGYLKTSVHGNCVSLFVMPYNYPVLFYLLGKWNKALKEVNCFSWFQYGDNSGKLDLLRTVNIKLNLAVCFQPLSGRDSATTSFPVVDAVTVEPVSFK